MSTLATARAYRRRHRRQGLCIRCAAPAAVDWDGKVLHACERHLRKDRKRKRSR